MSAVAGIVDIYGGLRVIVGPESHMWCHAKADEEVFLIDGLDIEEPVPWEKIPWLMRTVENEIEHWIKTQNDPDAVSIGMKLYIIKSRQSSVHIHDIVET